LRDGGARCLTITQVDEATRIGGNKIIPSTNGACVVAASIGAEIIQDRSHIYSWHTKISRSFGNSVGAVKLVTAFIASSCINNTRETVVIVYGDNTCLSITGTIGQGLVTGLLKVRETVLKASVNDIRSWSGKIEVEAITDTTGGVFTANASVLCAIVGPGTAHFQCVSLGIYSCTIAVSRVGPCRITKDSVQAIEQIELLALQNAVFFVN
jgi:hypothetical protein